MKIIIGFLFAIALAGCGSHGPQDSADGAPIDSGTPDALSCSEPLWLASDAISRCTENGYAVAEYSDRTVYRVTCTEYDEESIQCLTEWVLESPSENECMTAVYDGPCRTML